MIFFFIVLVFAQDVCMFVWVCILAFVRRKKTYATHKDGNSYFSDVVVVVVPYLSIQCVCALWPQRSYCVIYLCSHNLACLYNNTLSWLCSSSNQLSTFFYIEISISFVQNIFSSSCRVWVSSFPESVCPSGRYCITMIRWYSDHNSTIWNFESVA
jgi:hypothetical protein